MDTILYLLTLLLDENDWYTCHYVIMLIERLTVHQLGWGEDGEAWRWRRRLLAWVEDLVVELRNLLSNVTLQEFVSDVWLW